MKEQLFEYVRARDDAEQRAAILEAENASLKDQLNAALEASRIAETGRLRAVEALGFKQTEVDLMRDLSRRASEAASGRRVWLLRLVKERNEARTQLAQAQARIESLETAQEIRVKALRQAQARAELADRMRPFMDMVDLVGTRGVTSKRHRKYYEDERAEFDATIEDYDALPPIPTAQETHSNE